MMVGGIVVVNGLPVEVVVTKVQKQKISVLLKNSVVYVTEFGTIGWLGNQEEFL